MKPTKTTSQRKKNTKSTSENLVEKGVRASDGGQKKSSTPCTEDSRVHRTYFLPTIIPIHTGKTLGTVSPAPGKCGCYYSLRESEISCWVTLEDVCRSALGGETPNPRGDLEFQKSFTALSMLENGISIDPDFSNFSRLTVEVVVLFPKDCHEGTMVKLCAETE